MRKWAALEGHFELNAQKTRKQCLMFTQGQEQFDLLHFFYVAIIPPTLGCSRGAPQNKVPPSYVCPAPITIQLHWVNLSLMT